MNFREVVLLFTLLTLLAVVLVEAAKPEPG